MLPAPPLFQPPEARILRRVRDVRFAAGVACVHCASTEVIRWGRFTGRQRYRCRRCTRTFSDLTATPMAYTKRLAEWPSYLSLMRSCTTIRDAAARLAMSPSTAFRWRHATLRGLHASHSDALFGLIEMRELMFPYSNKGQRRLGAARRRGARSELRVWVTTPREFVAIFMARSGPVRALCFEYGVVLPAEIRQFVPGALGIGSVVLADQPRGRMYAREIKSAGRGFVQVNRPGQRNPLHHVDNVTTYAQGLRRWFNRFRGIATIYRAHYLEWHALLFESDGWPLMERCLRGQPGLSRSPP